MRSKLIEQIAKREEGEEKSYRRYCVRSQPLRQESDDPCGKGVVEQLEYKSLITS